MSKDKQNDIKLTRLLELFDEESLKDFKNPAGRALWHLLTRWKDELPTLDGYFIKAFRQVDVTDDGNTDMAIWNLLNSESATTFWKLFERVQREKELKEKECNAVICHGPGHQSKTRCCLTGDHEIHEARYGNHDQLARWKGDKVFSGYFDEPPEEPDEKAGEEEVTN